MLAPRTKLSVIAAELSRRHYHGRVYAKAQNVRPAYITAHDAALADVDVLAMSTCLMTAPNNHRPARHLEAVEDNLTAMTRGFSRNTSLSTTGHPSLAGKSSAGACNSWGASSTMPSSCGSPMPTSTRSTGPRSAASRLKQ